MHPFPPPTRELAERILSEVGFQDRLVGYRTPRRMGPTPVSLYSLEEAMHLLCEEIPQLDLDRLATWVREVIQDTALAEAIETIAGTDRSDREKALAAGNRIASRILQCRRVHGTR